MYARTDKVIGMRKQNSSRIVEKVTVGTAIKKTSLVFEILEILSQHFCCLCDCQYIQKPSSYSWLGSFDTLE